MRWRSMYVAIALVSAVGISACAPDGSRTPPVVMELGELQGETVQLLARQVLQIDPGSLAADTIHGVIQDPNIAQFVVGAENDSGTWWPKVFGVADGTTEVVLSNSDAGIQDVVFTVEVTG